LGDKLVEIRFVAIVHVERVEVFVVKSARIDDLPEQNILLAQMRLNIIQRLLVLDGLECVVGESNSRSLQIPRGIVVQGIQLGIASFVTLVETKDLSGVEPAEETICMCGFILASLLIRELQSLFGCQGQ
jgi:hypothetical protein